MLSGLRKGVVSGSVTLAGSQLSMELFVSVKELELLTGAAPALMELVLSLLAALRELNRHEVRRPGWAGAGIILDGNDLRDVCCIESGTCCQGINK